MTAYEKLVTDFNVSFSHPVGIDLLNNKPMDLRLDLITEELSELKDAVIDYYANPCPENKADLLKELADLQYVVSGFAVTFGLPLEEAFKRVHISNMSKLGENGFPILREDGKILKGPFYKEPNLEDLVDVPRV